MREIKSEAERQRDKAIRQVKKNIDSLRGQGYTIEVCPTETMIGTIADHIYARVRGKKTIFEQKYLFTLDKKE